MRYTTQISHHVRSSARVFSYQFFDSFGSVHVLFFGGKLVTAENLSSFGATQTFLDPEFLQELPQCWMCTVNDPTEAVVPPLNVVVGPG